MSEGTWLAFALIVLGNRNLRKKKKSYVLSPATSLSIAAQHSPPTEWNRYGEQRERART